MARWPATVCLALLLGLSAATPPSAEGALSALPPPSIAELQDSMERAVAGKAWNYAASHAKQIAVFYDQREQYDKAAHYYDLNAAYWEKYGKPGWGIANAIRADHIRTVVDVYAEVPAEDGGARRLGKFEPRSGAYVGLYPAGKGFSGSPSGAEAAFGMKHAVYLTYTRFNRRYADRTAFPLAYARKVKELGGALQIGWEPRGGLDEVRDDAYLRQFAREAAASGMPVFLRFACEMNGEWVPWHGDPARYVEKWRLVHDIMAEEAPNVAMVWSPNFLPRDNIDPYYPGDEYVDWVGFSLYTIPYSHGERKPGGNPVDYLRPLYGRYGHKPIMISEGAVSFYSYQLDEDFTRWGVWQLANMYAYMPRLYPMIKSITYFDLDKRTTDYDNQNNNYDLHDSPEMLAAYKKLTSSPYFLDAVADGAAPPRPVAYRQIAQAGPLPDRVKLFVYVKLPLGKQPYSVQLHAPDGKLINRAFAPPFDMEVNMGGLPQAGGLTVKVLDERDRLLTEKTITYTR